MSRKDFRLRIKT